ncbi:MAG: outer membrane lipoprotein-sorting protein [Verrucomicrobiota bacterium]
MKRSLLFLLLTSLFSPIVAAEPALIAAEQSRGISTGNTGVQWTVSVSGEKNAKFVATSQGGKVFAEVIEPADAVGRRYLAEAKGNMWFWKPGISRPVSVSKKQRLSGDAAIGDIASTSFVDGYKLVGKEAGEIGGEAATIYSLKANSFGDTYAMIKYWVTNGENLGKKAEFFAKSGTSLRTSTMEYKNSANGRPFLSKMVVKDSSKTITLQFSNIRLGSYPSRMFERDNLGGPKSKGGPKG